MADVALENYGVLKGVAKQLALDGDASPHIELLLEAHSVKYRVAINVRSKTAPHDLLYLKRDPFFHSISNKLLQLPMGFTNIREEYSHLALDYVRGALLAREEMEVAPFTRVGPFNDLRDYIESMVQAAIDNPSVYFYAFGESWGPSAARDKYFGFSPGRGIHDIHMNQGSSGRFRGSNGPNQDGALLVHFTQENRWSAIFLAFQSQSWVTDTEGQPRCPPVCSTEPQSQNMRSGVVIVAALIGPYGEEWRREAVTLLNRSDTVADLEGWRIEDQMGSSAILSGQLDSGETLRVTLNDEIQLGHQGGEVKLYAPDGTLVDRVHYSKAQAAREGWTTVFWTA